VDNRAEVRKVLTSRRAKITPEQAGLPEVGQRRVPGLRRSEVAALAQMSVEYYAKLERGSLGGVSAGILDASAEAIASANPPGVTSIALPRSGHDGSEAHRRG
jgi:Helix-turn-helix domain